MSEPMKTVQPVTAPLPGMPSSTMAWAVPSAVCQTVRSPAHTAAGCGARDEASVSSSATTA
ncbi:hypothetical protein ABZ797_03890 [Streptomyces antimycoticus]|uniref:hypothetical protein n=1 Tax=Streptomyces antimycoticus TaxID=68175 RepID=UPI0033C24B16